MLPTGRDTKFPVLPWHLSDARAAQEFSKFTCSSLMFVGRIKDGVVKIELVTEQGAFGGHVKECLWSTMVDHMKQPIVVGLHKGACHGEKNGCETTDDERDHCCEKEPFLHKYLCYPFCLQTNALAGIPSTLYNMRFVACLYCS